MEHFYNFLVSHPGLMLACGWTFSAVVGAMPELPPNATWLVRWVHDSLQVIGANVSRTTFTKK